MSPSIRPIPTVVRWVPCPGDPALQVSDAGQVRRQACGRLLTQHDHGKGYLYVTIGIGSNRQTVRVNRLVATAFYGPQPRSIQAAHLNNDRGDNRAVNLAWKTPKGNAADRRSHGTQVRGEQIHTAKLTAEMVALIRQRMAEGACDVAIAIDFKIGRQAANKIRTGKTWKHVPVPDAIANPAGRRRRAQLAAPAEQGAM